MKRQTTIMLECNLFDYLTKIALESERSFSYVINAVLKKHFINELSAEPESQTKTKEQSNVDK